ncbi:MAG TPA: FHA domain-containing protein [Polyangiaceae bacterium]|nr:FHA domain-containing protein [Polyangiaceae bacterium]
MTGTRRSASPTFCPSKSRSRRAGPCPATERGLPQNLTLGARTALLSAVRCERCGRDNQSHVTFCLGCGMRLSRGPAPAVAAEPPAEAPQVVCDRCHQPNRPTYRFCLSCGNPLGEGGASKAGPSPAPPEPPAAPPAPRPAAEGGAPRNGAPPPSLTLASMQASPSAAASDEAQPIAAMPVIHLGPREAAAPARPSSPPPPGAPASPTRASTPPAPPAPARASSPGPAAPPRASAPPNAPAAPPARASSPSNLVTPQAGPAIAPNLATPPARLSTPGAPPARPSTPGAPPARTSSPSIGGAPSTSAPAAASAPPAASQTKQSPAPARAPTPFPALPPLPGSDAEAPQSSLATRCPRCQTGAALGQLFCRSCGFALDFAPGGDATKQSGAPFFTPPQGAKAADDDVLNTVVNAPALGAEAGDDDATALSSGEGAAPLSLARDGGPALPMLGPDDATRVGAAGLDESEDSTVPARPRGPLPEVGVVSPQGPATAHQRPTIDVTIARQRAIDPSAPTTPHGRLLVYTHNSTEGAPFALVGSPIDIGSREGQIRLAEDPYVAPLHVRLVLEGGRWHLTDLGTLNGVYRRLAPSVELGDGDLILLGQQVLRFELVMDAERALRPAYQHGVALFGTPAAARYARLCQRTVEGVTRDVVHVGRDEMTLGREGTDLSFPDDGFLSRRHAVLRRDAASGRFRLEDAGSSNGTFVSVRGRVAVRDGDVFRVGLHLLRFEVPEPPGDGAAEGRAGEGPGGRGGSA